MTEQYLRRTQLLVKNLSSGIDLSEMHIRFEVNQSDFETPNHAIIKVWGLSIGGSRGEPDTAGQLLGEFTDVILGVSYGDDPPVQIFKGTIKQVRRGKDTPTDTYVEIIAADGDEAYNFAIVKKSLAAPASSSKDRINAIVAGMAANGVNSFYAPGVVFGPTEIRGKVEYGLARDLARDLAEDLNATWSIQGGVLTFNSLTGYLPGEAVVLTSKTGMVGLPRQTMNGIEVRCLINPKIKVGGAVKIDNKSIQTAQINLAGITTPDAGNSIFTGINNLPAIAADGLYKVLVAEHHGDTRGEDWYTELTCLAINPSQPADNSVKPYKATP